MITIKCLKLYKRYSGDGDAFVRSGTNEEKNILNYENWKLIEGLIQDVGLMKKDLASNSYVENLNKRLQELCENEETIKLLKEIA